MWEALQEASSVLSTLKNVTPSNRSDVASTQGVGDRSEIGKSAVSGQHKIWGNLDGQSRGMDGRLDTQGKAAPELYATHQGSGQSNNPGTYTPPKYKELYKERINESANASATGVGAGKHKASAASGSAHSGLGNKYVQGGDTHFGGSCNCSCGEGKKKVVTEAQLVGSAVALVGCRALSEAFRIG